MPGQVAELLAADGVQGTEDDDLALLAALHDRLEPGAERERRLAGAGAAAEADDADVGVEQEVEGDPLLGAAAVQAEGVAVAAHEAHLLVGADPAEAASARREQDEPGVARQLGGRGVLDAAVLVEVVHLLDGDVELGHAGPAASRRRARRGTPRPPGRPADALTRIGRSLLTTVTSKPSSDRFLATDEDAGVVVAEPEAGRQRARVGVVELDPQGAAVVADRDRGVEPALAGSAGRRAAAAPGGRSSPARGGGAWPRAR